MLRQELLEQLAVMKLQHKMKITKIELMKEKGILTVWTDTDENTGFNFRIKDIVDKADLKNKVKLRVPEHLNKQQQEKDNEIKFQSLEGVEGLSI